MTNQTPIHAPPSRRRLFVAATVAIVVSAVIAIAFVLPAEFGIDPTGIGRLTGLIEISSPLSSPELELGARRKDVLTLFDHAPPAETGKKDRWEIELAGYESIEFKYTLEQGARMAFTWRSSQSLRYDMHAHPFDGGEELTESYGVGDAALMQGLYVAPFTGIHGWYWQNRTLQPVKLVLEASGGFSTSTLFDTSGKHPRPIVSTAQ